MPDETPNIGESVEKITGLLLGTPPGKVAEEPESSVAATPDEVPSALVPQVDPEAGADELTPTALAEKLGIKPNEFFTKFRIPVDGGDPLTLEEFKDAGKELRGVKVARDELAEAKVTFENNVMQQRQSIQAALQKVPTGVLTPEMLKEVQAEHQELVKTERIELHRIRPDLADPTKWQQTRDLLVEHLKPYGFHAVEVDSIVDHRLAKYIIDNAERAERLKQLNADGLQVKKIPAQRPTSAPQPASKRADKKEPGAAKRKRTDKRGEQVAAVAKLIGDRPQ